MIKTKLDNYISEYSVRNKQDEDIPVYSVTNSRGFCQEYFSKDVASQDRTTYKIVPKGYFAYNPSRINVGSVDWQRNEDKVIVSPLYVVFSVSSELNQQYLYYYLKSDMMLYYIKEFATGSVRDNLKIETLKKFPIPYISLEKQALVVANLDKVNELIFRQKQLISKLDDLVKSRFVEMFGELDLSHVNKDWVKISSIGDVVGGSTPKTANSEYWDGEYRWLTPAELEADTGYIYDSERKITKAGAESCSLKALPVNTVILTSRAPIGKVAIAGATFYCNQGFKNIICNDKIIPRYLYSLLLYNVEFLNSLGRGATFKEISKSIVENILIPLPTIELQKQFAAFVEKIDKSKFCIKKAIFLMSIIMGKSHNRFTIYNREV